MSSLGTVTVDQIGRPIYVSADGKPEYKTRGITFDWSLVAAVAQDTTLPDDTVVKSGSKYIRFGQVVCRVGTAEVQTYTWTGGPTAGAAVLTFPAAADRLAESTTPLAFNATAAQVQAALEALPHVGVGGAVVSVAGAGSAGSPYVFTVTFARALGNIAQPTQTNTFSGGTTPTATIATTTPGVGSNKFGPYDPAQSDGRQTLARGDSFIINATHLESSVGSDFVPGAIEGGQLFKQRVLMTQGTHSLAAGPTQTEVEAAFPRVRWTE